MNLFLNITFRIILIYMILISAIFVSPALANSKYAAIIIEEHTGKVLFSRFADHKRYPASLTKVMTIYIVFEEIKKGKINFNTKLTVSARAEGQPPSKLGLKKGETISVKDALLALVTKSANDVATTIAENISISEIGFAKRMTQTARKLGMVSTTFMNASGLYNKYQKTTARDMTLLAVAIRSDFPNYYNIFNTQKFSWKNKVYKNHNKLLDAYAGTDGIKTGYIDASGFNLMASVERKNIRLVGIVFGGKTGQRRDSHLIGLFNKSFPLATSPKLVKISSPTKKPQFAKLSSPKIKPKIINSFNFVNLPISRPVNTTTNNTLFQLAVEKNWSVQIGIFSKKVNAHRTALVARRIAPDFLTMLPAQLSPVYVAGNSAWRVRFSELDENSARSICSQLLRKSMSCIPISNLNSSGFQ